MKKILSSTIIGLSIFAYASQTVAGFVFNTPPSSVGWSYTYTPHAFAPPGPPVYKLKANIVDSLIKAGFKVQKLEPIGNSIKGKNLDRIALICRKTSILGHKKCEYYGIPNNKVDLALVKPAEKGEVEEFQGVAIENPDLSVTYDRENKYIIVIKKSGDE